VDHKVLEELRVFPDYLEKKVLLGKLARLGLLEP
jgi:hypothetical protein